MSKGGGCRSVEAGAGNTWAPAKARPYETLIRALARAHRWNRMLDAGGGEVPLEVSRRIKKEFENGHDYYVLHDREVHCPESAAARPDAAVLTWYNEKRYLG